MKFPVQPFLFVEKTGRTRLDIADQIGQGNVRLHADKYMNVIAHTVNRNQFLIAILHDSCYVFEQFFFLVRRNQRLPALNCKDYLDIYLCVRVCH